MISGPDAKGELNKTAGLVFHQDPVEDLLKVFDAAFRIVVPGPGRQLIGLKAISEKQNGAPGWYLWFEDHPGAYLLELAAAGTGMATADGPAVHREAVQGSYRIKYYPDPADHSSLPLFSEAERAFRESDCFDDTGTPDFERGEEIPETFFQVGTIEAALAADNRGLVLRLDAQDRWVTRMAEGMIAHAEQGDLRRLRAPREKDRDVPAWEWSWFLMDRLVLTLCLAYAACPWQVALHDAPGHAFRIHRGGVSRAVPEETIRRRWLSISFRLHDGHTSCTGSLVTLPEDPSLLMEPPAGERLAAFHSEPVESHSWVPAAWWHIRETHLDLGSVLPC